MLTLRLSKPTARLQVHFLFTHSLKCRMSSGIGRTGFAVSVGQRSYHAIYHRPISLIHAVVLQFLLSIVVQYCSVSSLFSYMLYHVLHTVSHKKTPKFFHHKFYNSWLILIEIGMHCLGYISHKVWKNFQLHLNNFATPPCQTSK